MVILRRAAMVILGGALVVTLVGAYMSMILTDNESLTSELKSAKADRDQSMEKLTAVRYNELAGYDGFAPFHDSDNLKIKIVNDGPSPAGIRYLLLYCISDEGCPRANDVPDIKSPLNNPTHDGSSIVMLNPGETTTIQLGPVLDGMRYRADIITDRGNILHTENCMVDLAYHVCRI